MLLEKRGYCNFRLDRQEEAINDFTSAIALSTNQYQLFFFRGNAYLRAEQYDQAIKDFDSLITQRPRHSSALNQRGLAYIGKKEKETACLDFIKSSEMGNLSAKYNVEKYCQ